MKQETDMLQKPQENSAARGSSAAREPAVNDSQHLAEMTEDLETFFKDA